MPRCPHCSQPIDVQFIKAPAMQADTKINARVGNGGGGSDLKELLEQIDDDTLSGKAAAFVTQTRERFEQYGDRTRMSDKQMEWLRSIASGKEQEW